MPLLDTWDFERVFYERVMLLFRLEFLKVDPFIGTPPPKKKIIPQVETAKKNRGQHKEGPAPWDTNRDQNFWR